MARQPCEGACGLGTEPATYYCQLCDCDLCDDCWSQQAAHKPGKKAHEKLSRRLVQVLDPILNPPTDPKIRGEQLRDDAQSKWFAWHKDDDGSFYVNDYDRYAHLMLDSMPDECPAARYPHIVSVIGETGNGKSTIINMFIDLPAVDTDEQLPSDNIRPVIGSINDNLPTTGNVHLYSDPVTFRTERPILLADMEGLRGGELKPLAEECLAHDKTSSPHGLRYEINQKIRGSSKILWADRPEKQTREHAVTHLYPKVLYTFSDVVIFVMRCDFRSFESVLTQLIDWANKSIECSVNQPMMPHAIIVSNFTDNDSDEDSWDVKRATRKLLEDFAHVVHKNPKFQDLRRMWRERGFFVDNIEELLLRYYSSVSIVRIPYKDSYGRVKDQIFKLRSEVQRRCDEAFERKRRSRFVLDADMLQNYLMAGFDHFAAHLDTAFDFLEIAMRINPISRDLSGNILQVANLVKMWSPVPKQTPRDIFGRSLARFISSCILLDIIRSQRPGDPVDAMRRNYYKLVDQALERFASHVWPCSFTSNQQQCTNVQAFHQKGHQSSEGRVIGAGEYQSNFEVDDYRNRWHELLEHSLLTLYSGPDNDASGYFAYHVKVLRQFYRDAGSAKLYKSHAACFSCLHAFPEHPLPCGHILCTKCIEDHGSSDQPGEILVRECPLHHTHWPSTYRIRFKPAMAGVRILSLDGGGVRGIVILELLKALEVRLPLGIQPQRFFDLIVGTSTGGLIALGLGVKGWTIDYAIEQFKSLVGKAFTPRWLGSGALAIKGSRYRTKPFEEALRSSLGESNLFGGDQSENKTCAKVAITSTTYPGQKTVLFTNYNRKSNHKVFCDWNFERPHDPKDELRLWEVGRATSAAPTIFKPFIRSKTRQAYIDGALYYKNPVKLASLESKLLFPDTCERDPDFLLSIGTGEEESRSYSPSFKSPHTEILDLPQATSQGFLSQRTKIPFMHKLFKDFMSRTLEAERAWANFHHDASQTSSDPRNRFLRLNMKFSSRDFPKMEEARRVESLQETTFRQLNSPRWTRKLNLAANRMVSSSFYFNKQSQGLHEDHYRCRGEIRCRFTNGSMDIRNLGRWLQDRSYHGFTPYFEIGKRSLPGPDDKLEIDEELIDSMMRKAHFIIEGIYIPMNDQQDETYLNLVLNPGERHPISGFPARFTPKPSPSPIRLEEESHETRSSIDTTASGIANVALNAQPTVPATPTLGKRRGTFRMFGKQPTVEEERPSQDSRDSRMATSSATYSDDEGRSTTTSPRVWSRSASRMSDGYYEEFGQATKTTDVLPPAYPDALKGKLATNGVTDDYFKKPHQPVAVEYYAPEKDEDLLITSAPLIAELEARATNLYKIDTEMQSRDWQRRNTSQQELQSCPLLQSSRSSLQLAQEKPHKTFGKSKTQPQSRMSMLFTGSALGIGADVSRDETLRKSPPALRRATFDSAVARPDHTTGKTPSPKLTFSKSRINSLPPPAKLMKRRPPDLVITEEARPDSLLLGSNSTSYSQPPLQQQTQFDRAHGSHDTDIDGSQLSSQDYSVAAAGETNLKESKIYRVVHDFKATKQGQIEVKAGEYVSLLTQCTNDQAICASLDMLKIGIIPGSCLEKHPFGHREPRLQLAASGEELERPRNKDYPDLVTNENLYKDEASSGRKTPASGDTSPLWDEPGAIPVSKYNAGLSPQVRSGNIDNERSATQLSPKPPAGSLKFRQSQLDKTKLHPNGHRQAKSLSPSSMVNMRHGPAPKITVTSSDHDTDAAPTTLFGSVRKRALTLDPTDTEVIARHQARKVPSPDHKPLPGPPDNFAWEPIDETDPRAKEVANAESSRLSDNPEAAVRRALHVAELVSQRSSDEYEHQDDEEYGDEDSDNRVEEDIRDEGDDGDDEGDDNEEDEEAEVNEISSDENFVVLNPNRYQMRRARESTDSTY